MLTALRASPQVGTLGSGLSDTVTGVAGGLGKVATGAGQTAAAPFTSQDTKEGGGEGGAAAADEVKGAADKAVEGAGEAGGKASKAAGEAGGKASEAAGSAKDTVGGAAGEGQKKLGLSE